MIRLRKIPVYAIDGAEVIYRGNVNGYGGVVILRLEIEDTVYTALYGHLDLDSVLVEVGDNITKGDVLAFFGEGYSEETDGERKHLHFSLHKGGSVEFRGYVQTESELDDWVDPEGYY